MVIKTNRPFPLFPTFQHPSRRFPSVHCWLEDETSSKTKKKKTSYLDSKLGWSDFSWTGVVPFLIRIYNSSYIITIKMNAAVFLNQGVTDNRSEWSSLKITSGSFFVSKPSQSPGFSLTRTPSNLSSLRQWNCLERETSTFLARSLQMT